jgi:hypothetical protein
MARIERENVASSVLRRKKLEVFQFLPQSLFILESLTCGQKELGERVSLEHGA